MIPTNFDYFKEEVKSLVKDYQLLSKKNVSLDIKFYSYSKLNPKQTKIHQELIQWLKIYKKLDLKIKLSDKNLNKSLYKKSIIKINQIIIDNIFNNSSMMSFSLSLMKPHQEIKITHLDILPFLIIIKKFGVPLDTKIDFHQKLKNINNIITSQFNVDLFLMKMRKVDLYLESFKADEKLKDQIFNNYMSNEKAKIEDAGYSFGIKIFDYEKMKAGLEQYEFIREKRKLENQVAIKSSQHSNKVKSKI